MPYKTFFKLTKEKKERIINAAVNEFSKVPYEQSMISEIIKEAKIPRGSFYQYFKDKKDLYLHVIDIIKEEKLKYLSETLKNPENLNFIDMIRTLYKDGVEFAVKNPKYVQILDVLLKNKNEFYDSLIKTSIKNAEEIYSSLIEKDKENGLIKKDIDTSTLAKLTVELTSNISIEELNLEDKEESYNRMLDRCDKIFKIIEFGVSRS